MKTKKQARQKKSLAHHTIHHTKRILRITPMFVHGMVIGAVVGVLTVVTLRATVASALSISSPRDCDSNAVITCGALSTTEIKQHYGDKGVAAIYKGVGITAKDIESIGETAVAGTVFKNGSVAINGTVVATNAITGGREYIAGSTAVTSEGVKFYTRAPSVSFRPNSLPAFVVMEKGQFKFAILAACGNFVTATPVTKATPPPPAPPVETPIVTTDVSTQTPPSEPVAKTASVTIAELPQTGPGVVIIIALLSVLGGYLFHATHRHVRRKRHLRHAAHTH